MSLTKSEARDLTREWLDDPDKEFWSDANLDLLLNLTLDDLWSKILRVNHKLKSQLDTVAAASVSSPGFVDLSSAGPLTERFYRLQHVTRDGTELTPVDPRYVAIEDDEVLAKDVPDDTYYVRDKKLWMFELDDSLEVEVRYSYLPAEFTSLAEATDVPWPDGHETAFTLEAAGRAMLKGGREDASDLLSIARASFNRLMARVSREHPGPRTPFTQDSPEDWGGN